MKKLLISVLVSFAMLNISLAQTQSLYLEGTECEIRIKEEYNTWFVCYPNPNSFQQNYYYVYEPVNRCGNSIQTLTILGRDLNEACGLDNHCNRVESGIEYVISSPNNSARIRDEILLNPSSTNGSYTNWATTIRTRADGDCSGFIRHWPTSLNLTTVEVAYNNEPYIDIQARPYYSTTTFGIPIYYNTLNKRIYVNNSPSINSLNIENRTGYCENDLVTINANHNSSDINEFIWTSVNGATLIAGDNNSATFRLGNANSETFSLTIQNGCGQSDTKTITINNLNPAIFPNGPKSVYVPRTIECYNSPYTFGVINFQSGVLYEWEIKNHNQLSGIILSNKTGYSTDISFSNSAPASFEIRVNAIDCGYNTYTGSYQTVNIGVLENCELNRQGKTSDDNEQLSENSDIKIIPNPSTSGLSNLVVVSESTPIESISIASINGVHISSSRVNGKRAEIQKLQPGVYLFKIKTSKTIQNKKVIVR